MKSVSILAIAASLVYAAPSERRAASAITDTVILNFALTLEHLENAYYIDGLQQFDEQAFTDAGLPVWARGRFSQISQHEAVHVAFLEGALGSEATQPCNYSFPFTDPPSFTALSAILENVGDSAYLGAAQFVSDKTVLTAAASILSTEGRHQAWVNSAVNKQTPWSGSFVTPLGFNQVFTLASPFITSCPSSNPDLGVQAFPALTVDPAAPVPGSNITLTFNSTGAGSDPLYLAVLSGLTTKFAPISNNQATLPEGLQGFVYAVVTNNATDATDASTVAGPTILSFPFNSAASNPQ
ncbi:hypothetical protein K439DRAFT_1202039 [Ramaria rubella]|nr:hypothetical protein K439DRAFT_1202039 [Ramaria rubella]